MNSLFWITFVCHGASSARAAAAANWTGSSSNFLGRRMAGKTLPPPDLKERCSPHYQSVDFDHGICSAWKGCGVGDWHANGGGEVYWWACGAKCPDGPYVHKDCSCACECPSGNCRPWSSISESTPAPKSATPPTSATPPPTIYQPQEDRIAVKKEAESEPAPPPAADSKQRGLVLREVDVVLIVTGCFLIVVPLLCYGCFLLCRSGSRIRVFPWNDEVEPPKIVLQRADLPQLRKSGEMSSRRSGAEEFEEASTRAHSLRSNESRRSSVRSNDSLRSSVRSNEPRMSSVRSNASHMSPMRSNESRMSRVSSIRSRSSEPTAPSVLPQTLNESRMSSLRSNASHMSRVRSNESHMSRASSMRTRSIEPRSSVSPPNVSPRSSVSEGQQKYYPGWDLRVNRNQSLPPLAERRSVNSDRSLPPPPAKRVSQSRSPR
jgi:hypothetical protein